MKIKDKMSARIRDMLTKDKLAFDEGFMTAFRADIKHLIGDYFDLDGDLQISVEQRPDGKYVVSVMSVASKIKTFGTTFERNRISG